MVLEQFTQVIPELIKDEVEMVGFSAELLEVIENNQEDLLRHEYLHSQSSMRDINDVEEDSLKMVRSAYSSNSIKTCIVIVDGMTCASCQQVIETHLRSLNGVISATVSLLTHRCEIKYRPKFIGVRTLIEEVEATGFSARYEA